jgi:MFS family permease
MAASASPVVLLVFPAHMRATPTSAFMTGGLMGPLLGMAAGGAVAAHLGWRRAFAVTATFGLYRHKSLTATTMIHRGRSKKLVSQNIHIICKGYGANHHGPIHILLKLFNNIR